MRELAVVGTSRKCCWPDSPLYSVDVHHMRPEEGKRPGSFVPLFRFREAAEFESGVGVGFLLPSSLSTSPQKLQLQLTSMDLQSFDEAHVQFVERSKQNAFTRRSQCARERTSRLASILSLLFPLSEPSEP